ncbi:MAG: ankyrin repeat domain-containing protein [Pseudomonadota bacterium]
MPERLSPAGFAVEIDPLDPRKFIIAAAQGRMCCMRQMMQRGIEADASPDGKPSALCYAAMQGNIEMAKLLVNHGADVNFTDRLGCTPAHYAAISSSADCLAFFIGLGADLTAVNHQHKTAQEYCQCARMAALCEQQQVVLH